MELRKLLRAYKVNGSVVLFLFKTIVLATTFVSVLVLFALLLWYSVTGKYICVGEPNIVVLSIEVAILGLLVIYWALEILLFMFNQIKKAI